MARNFVRIFIENNPAWGTGKNTISQMWTGQQENIENQSKIVTGPNQLNSHSEKSLTCKTIGSCSGGSLFLEPIVSQTWNAVSCSAKNGLWTYSSPLSRPGSWARQTSKARSHASLSYKLNKNIDGYFTWTWWVNYEHQSHVQFGHWIPFCQKICTYCNGHRLDLWSIYCKHEGWHECK